MPEARRLAPSLSAMRFPELLSPDHVVLDLESAEKRGVFQELTDRLVASGRVPKTRRAKILQALDAREEIGSTGIGRGVGIPHAKVAGLSGLHLAVGIHRHGIDYRAIDGELVHAVVLIVRAEQQNDEHLALLKMISQVGRHRDCRSFLLQAKSPQEIVDILEELSHG
jgi:mannitol/fructose-specific phosphotransferase system IIA component (Ntr-type)